jgi:Ca2+-binding EF-hand superfamily protein
MLLVVAIGLADVLFAVDSIPAVFGITTLLITVLAGMIRSRRMMEHVTGSRAPAPAAGGAAGYRIPPDAEEQAVLERRFAVLDIDGNGVWQRDDHQRLTRRLCEAFGQAAGSAAGQAVAAGQRSLFDALLPHMDADGDQEITQDEFIAAVSRTVSDRAGFDAAVRTAARTLVQVADQDGNGALDPGEYARLGAVYGARAHEAAQAFGRLDRDRSGLLDTAELAEAISQFFTSRDPGSRGNLAFGHL